MTKDKAGVDLWLKEIAPSTELRKWFAHDPEKWTGFQHRYKEDLSGNPEALAQLKRVVREHRKVTLLFGAKDTEHNEAVVLRTILARAGSGRECRAGTRRP